MGDNRTALIEGLDWQLDLCRANGSPTYVAILTDLRERLTTPDGFGPVDGEGHRLLSTLRADPGEPIRSALFLRLLGAVQRVCLGDPAAPLREVYETLGGRHDPARAAELFYPYAIANLAAVEAGLAAPVQTNETGRAAPLAAGIAHAVRETGIGRVRLLDVGASAGLNLCLDAFRIQAPSPPGGATRWWGPEDSPLRLEGHFTGAWPETGAHDSAWTVVERRGVDLSPLDVTHPETGCLLRSFVWPEDVARRRRLDGALAAAGQGLDRPAAIDRSRAVPWIVEQLTAPALGLLTIVMHSVTMVYFEDEEAAEFLAVLARAGAGANSDSPIALIGYEVDVHEPTRMALTCTIWPHPGVPVRLATGTAHGADVRPTP